MAWLHWTTSLRVKYALVGALLAIVIIVSHYFIVTPIQVSEERSAIMTRAQASATLGAGQIVSGYTTNKDAVGFELAKVMQQLITQMPMFDQFVLVSNQGQLLYDSQVVKPANTTSINLQDTTTVKNLQSNQTVVSTINNVTYLYYPYFDSQSNHIDTIRYTVDLTQLNQVRQLALTQLILELLIFIPASFIGFYFMTSRTVSKPIDQIHSDINLIASGEKDHRIHLARRDELGGLADGINSMTHTLLDNVANVEEEKVWKSEFMAMASDNLRPPLTALMQAITELKKAGNNNDLKKPITDVEKQSQELHGLLENLIGILALKGGEQKIADKPFDLMEVIIKLAKAQEPYLKERGLTLTIETRANHIIAHGDQDKVAQILENLVDNAIKFTATGGITIRADDHKELIHLSVIDTGAGIEEKMIHKLFDSFHQGATPMTGEQRSSGLGLYFAKLAIEAQGGEIAIHSKPGQGTEVALTLKKG